MLPTPKIASRRHSTPLKVGKVAVGGDAPISVQSMTNTPSQDAQATLAQVEELYLAGADIVRVSIPDQQSADALASWKPKSPCPIIADIHFDYQMAIASAKSGADCLRINPGNIGNESKIQEVIQCAKDHQIPIRIGVNAGSLEKDLQLKYKEPNAQALVESALRHVDILDRHDFSEFKVSIKASDPFLTIDAYRLLAQKISQPLHLGVTEAGSLRTGTVKSTLALATLLQEGIGDTLRISLAADPVEEVKVGWDLLRVLGLRKRGVSIVACPSCSRQNFDVIGTVNAIESMTSDIEKTIDVAMIGCYVNGPGESRIADIGVTGASPNHLIYIKGKPAFKVSTDELVEKLNETIREQVLLKHQVIATSTS